MVETQETPFLRAFKFRRSDESKRLQLDGPPHALKHKKIKPQKKKEMGARKEVLFQGDRRSSGEGKRGKTETSQKTTPFH